MTDKPIIFSGPMVRALIEGRKTQTRRVLNPQPEDQGAVLYSADNYPQFCKDGFATFSRRNAPPQHVKLPYAPGDRLYVREAWQTSGMNWGRRTRDMRLGLGAVHYAATDKGEWKAYWGNWKPSTHMPRWASRLTLTVTDVRVTRLQNISASDAIEEGINPCLEGHNCPDGYGGACCGQYCPQDNFHDLWDSLHGPDAWDANPWVVALTFTVEWRNIDHRVQE